MIPVYAIPLPMYPPSLRSPPSGVANVEIQYGTIIGKRCPVFDYTEKKFVMVDAYKK